MKTKRVQPQFSIESDSKHNRRVMAEDALIHLAIISTVICGYGIKLVVEYGVAIDHFVFDVLK